MQSDRNVSRPRAQVYGGRCLSVACKFQAFSRTAPGRSGPPERAIVLVVVLVLIVDSSPGSRGRGRRRGRNDGHKSFSGKHLRKIESKHSTNPWGSRSLHGGSWPCLTQQLHLAGFQPSKEASNTPKGVRLHSPPKDPAGKGQCRPIGASATLGNQEAKEKGFFTLKGLYREAERPLKPSGPWLSTPAGTSH